MMFLSYLDFQSRVNPSYEKDTFCIWSRIQ